MKHSVLMLALVLMGMFSIPAEAATRDEQRGEIQQMRTIVLDKLYTVAPNAKEQIANASGYAVFSSADVAALFISGSVGRGIAHNNRTGEETYMQMASAGVGLGLGVKDFRAVFIFDNQNVYNDFITTGLDLSGNVDIAAKGGKTGGAITGTVDVLPGVRVYQMTESGLLAQAMLKGTKYWRDASLNEIDQSSSYNR